MLAEEIVKPRVESVVVQPRVCAAIRQEPYLGFNALGDVYLAGLQAPKVAAGNRSAARLSEAAEAWGRVKDTGNVAVLDAIIARFNDTFYAGRRLTAPSVRSTM